MFKILGGYKKKLIIVITLVTMISIALTTYYKKEMYKADPQSIDAGYVYYQGDDAQAIRSKNTDIKSQFVTPYVYDKSFGLIENYSEQTDVEIPLQAIKWTSESSVDLVRNVTEKINNNQLSITLKMAYNNFPSYMSNVNINNDYLQIEHLIVGDYPRKEGEIIIPELYATFLEQIDRKSTV